MVAQPVHMSMIIDDYLDDG